MRLPPPIMAGLAAGAMWLVARYSGIAVAFPGQFAAALGLAAAGLALDLTSLFGFLRARTTVNPVKLDQSTALVTSGFYRISRNPMYLGLALQLTAWAVWLGDPLNGLVLAGFVALLTTTQIKPEEQALETAFGDAYRAYKARVRRWI